MSTTTFLKEAEQMAQSLGDAVKIESIVGEDLLKKGMGGIYNVGKASTTPPAFIHLSYTPKKCASDKHIAFVGKGIVYDSGGLTIKVGGNMCHMKADMAGAAAILGAFQLLVQTGFSAPLDAILCVAENCVGPNSLRKYVLFLQQIAMCRFDELSVQRRYHQVLLR